MAILPPTSYSEVRRKQLISQLISLVLNAGTEMWLSLLNLTVKESFKSWTGE